MIDDLESGFGDKFGLARDVKEVGAFGRRGVLVDEVALGYRCVRGGAVEVVGSAVTPGTASGSCGIFLGILNECLEPTPDVEVEVPDAEVVGAEGEGKDCESRAKDGG